MAERTDEQIVADGCNQFTNKLFTQISQPNENLIFSPLSAHTILSLAYQGSRGATESAFRDALNIPEKSQTGKGFRHLMSALNNVEGVTLNIANHVYLKTGYSLKAAFTEVATNQFFAGAENVDFEKSAQAAKTINSWVEQKTNNKIKDLVTADDFDENTRLVLINAVYFKGDWLHHFDKERTTDAPFYTSETESAICKMMHRTGKYNYKEDDTLDAQILQIFYKNEDFSMIIVLPRSRTGIIALEKKLATHDLTDLSKNLRNVEVIVSLPRFKVESTIELTEPLQKLGLAHAFGNNADFSELVESTELLKISKVLQKAFIEVNEEGAEAAAATSVMIMACCALVRGPVPIVFDANHPFVLILQQSDNVIFMGKNVFV